MGVSYNKGDKVKNYTIISDGPLRVGGFAISFLAKSDEIDEIFFKEYTDPTSANGDNFTKFIQAQREFKKRLDTISYAEQMYEVFEFGDEHGELHYQAKEFMKGKDLKKYFTDNPEVTINQRNLIACIILVGLMEIHKANIVHTDLKPEQIYLEEDPSIKMQYRVKICDFDFSRIPGEIEPIYPVTTPFFSSPEYIKGETVDFASDRFTIGLILYEVLTGNPNPYDIEDEEQYQEAILNYKVKPIAELMPNEIPMPSELSNMIYSLLSPEKEKRCELKKIHEWLINHPRWWEEDHPPIPIRVYLKNNSIPYKPSYHKASIVSRDELRLFPDYKFVSHQQFMLEKTKTGWKIRGLEDVTNNTFLDGKNITGQEAELHEGDRIFIGNQETKNGIEFEVEFVYE